MANTKFLGTDLLIYVGSTPIAHSRTASFKVSANLVDSTTKDSIGAWTEQLSATKSWELSTEGLAVWGSIDQWVDAITAGTPLQVSFKTLNQVTGDITYSGTAFVESCDITAPNAEVVTYSVNFKGSGPLVSTPKA